MSAEGIPAFRIARATRNYRADDLSGAGAARFGGRWNELRTPLVYASLSRALAALETLVHVREARGLALPLDRYLVEITLPAGAWEAREVFEPRACPDWNAVPARAGAARWGSTWAGEQRSLVAVVPSVIVPEEHNVLLNPLHADARRLRVRIARQWSYDPRFGA